MDLSVRFVGPWPGEESQAEIQRVPKYDIPNHEQFIFRFFGKAKLKRHFSTYVVFREFRWFWGARQIVNGSIQNILQNLCELIKNVLSTYLRATRLLFTILILTEHGDAICQDLGAHQVGVVKCLCLLNVGPHARREAYL